MRLGLGSCMHFTHQHRPRQLIPALFRHFFLLRIRYSPRHCPSHRRQRSRRQCWPSGHQLPARGSAARRQRATTASAPVRHQDRLSLQRAGCQDSCRTTLCKTSSFCRVCGESRSICMRQCVRVACPIGRTRQVSASKCCFCNSSSYTSGGFLYSTCGDDSHLLHEGLTTCWQPHPHVGQQRPHTGVLAKGRPPQAGSLWKWVLQASS